MDNQKLENQLNLALETSKQERMKSENLNVGYDEELNTWEIIIKYQGDIGLIENLDERIQIVLLMNGYAILTLPQELIGVVADLEEVEYIEKPKRLFFELNEARAEACANTVFINNVRLTGKGVIVAVIDSGIDYRHPDFRNEDGTSRILFLWDQTIEGEPPLGYRIGTEYTKEELDRALESENPLQIVPSIDTSSHGTHVAGIAAGNGRASNGRYRGVAPESDLIVVKLGVPGTRSFPRTTELMQAVDYSIKKALELRQPIAINISFGNTYGSHKGDSLLETYLNAASGVWKNVIVVGTGNEGAAAGHVSGQVENASTDTISIGVGNFETTWNLQIWKNYVDEMNFRIVAPLGESVDVSSRNGGQRYILGKTRVLVYYGLPTPYSDSQEIYIEFLPVEDFVDSGVWQIEVEGVHIVDGSYEMWLPSNAVLTPQTEFLYPSEDLTFTIPSTASKVITVAAYDSQNNTYADFSGRGYEAGRGLGKPDLAAPGVEIISAAPGGGYTAKSGTSMATPFVTGGAALLMEEGIVRGTDPFLYGEKVKAYLRRGARQIAAYTTWPNDLLGWGVLCVEDSLSGK